MKRIVLDTCFLINLFKNPESCITADLSTYGEVLLPSVVIGEFRAGLFPGKEGDRNRRILEEYCVRSFVRIVPVTERTAEVYAKVYQSLRKQGTPIPQNDMWIAACALEHGADIATQDEHFKAVPMLTVITIPCMPG